MLNSEIVKFNTERRTAILAKSKFVGVVKTRCQFLVRCDSKRAFNSRFATGPNGEPHKGSVINFQDLSGNLIVWFASSGKKDDLEVGKYYYVEASVKSHEPSAKWGNQTRVNRLTVLHEY